MTICPVPGCNSETAPRGVFCADHHFCLSLADRKLVYQMKFACERETDADRKRHLVEQLQGYISAAIRNMSRETGHAA